MLLRAPVALIVGVAVYLLVAALTVYDGFESLILQPVVGMILTGLSLVAVVAAGSPLLLPRVWRVWRTMWAVPLVLAALGSAAMAASFHPSLQVTVWDSDHQQFIRQPHPGFGIGGWFALLFGLLYQPRLSLTGDGRWL